MNILEWFDTIGSFDRRIPRASRIPRPITSKHTSTPSQKSDSSGEDYYKIINTGLLTLISEQRNIISNLSEKLETELENNIEKQATIDSLTFFYNEIKVEIEDLKRIIEYHRDKLLHSKIE